MEANRGKIITFYSHKGGTGRSMALANIACLLSRRADIRKGVIAIDWDLEAPGLHWFFRDRAEMPKASSERGGLIELFENLNAAVLASSPTPLSEESVQAVLDAVSIDRFVTPTGVSYVKLMQAGEMGADYGDRVSRFDWRLLFNRAPTLIRAFAERLAAMFDYVLVDSRTGHNDMSGICTALLPDHLVLVFTPNRQSLIGGIEAIGRAVRYRIESEDIRPLAVFPLPSRIDISEPELLEKWRLGDRSEEEDQKGYQLRFEAFFKDVYGLPQCDLKNYFDEMQIQHVPRYSYGEEIAVLRERGSRLSISRSYASFANILATGDSPWDFKPSAQGGAEIVFDEAARQRLDVPTVEKVRAAKEYLPEDRFKLKLHDLVTTEVGEVLRQLPRFSVQGSFNIQEFAKRLKSYEAVTMDLLCIEALLGYWGGASQRNLLSIGPKRIGDGIKPEGGLSVFIRTRWYPNVLLLYSGGVAAVAARQYENLYDLMMTRTADPFDRTDNPTLIRATAEVWRELNQAFGLLQNVKGRHTPANDYLFEFFLPVLEDVLFLGSEYEAAFDRFEVLYALQYAHLYDHPVGPRQFRFWGPPGRFVWKSGHPEAPLDRLITESELVGESWAPLEAGFFAGSLQRFLEVAEGYRQMISNTSWR